MDFLAHALAERRVNQLMALHAAPSRELAGHDQRLEMLSVADHFHMLAGEPRRDPVFTLSGVTIQYLSLYPALSSPRLIRLTIKKLTPSTARLA